MRSGVEPRKVVDVSLMLQVDPPPTLIENLLSRVNTILSGLKHRPTSWQCTSTRVMTSW